jgi:serine/threonine-protein kinase
MDIENAEKAIKNATIAGIISGVITLLVTLLSVTGVNILDFSLWNMLDVFLIFGLTFGIYRKSRICAVSMFIYFIGNRLLFFSSYGFSAVGLPIAILFAYFYFQGIRGAFAYHGIK